MIRFKYDEKAFLYPWRLGPRDYTDVKFFYTYSLQKILMPKLWNKKKYWIELELSDGSTVDVDIDHYYWGDQMEELANDIEAKVDIPTFDDINVVRAVQKSGVQSALYNECGINLRSKFFV